MKCKCEICRDNGNKCEEPAGSMYLTGVGYVCDKCAQEYPEDCIFDSESEPDKTYSSDIEFYSK